MSKRVVPGNKNLRTSYAATLLLLDALSLEVLRLADCAALPLGALQPSKGFRSHFGRAHPRPDPRAARWHAEHAQWLRATVRAVLAPGRELHLTPIPRECCNAGLHAYGAWRGGR